MGAPVIVVLVSAGTVGHKVIGDAEIGGTIEGMAVAGLVDCAPVIGHSVLTTIPAPSGVSPLSAPETMNKRCTTPTLHNHSHTRTPAVEYTSASGQQPLLVPQPAEKYRAAPVWPTQLGSGGMEKGGL